LPHTVVSFSVLGERIVKVSYIPKWRRCRPEFVHTLGGVYAHE